MTRWPLIGALASALWLGSAAGAAAQDLIADLSEHVIKITTVFTGGEVVLFGAVEGEGEVAVVVTGPRGPVTVRQKAPVAGIWVNRKNVTFPQAPGYYSVAVSSPLDKLGPKPVLERAGIGVEHLRLDPSRPMPPDQLTTFRDALVRNKQQNGLYAREPGTVQFLGARLFRANIHFPADVPTGLYTVEVLLLRDGEVVGAQTTPLAVSKSGFSAELYEFALSQPVMYGVGSVLLAAAAGWLAGLAFRRA